MSSSEVAGREGLGQDGLKGLHGSKVAVSLCLDKSFVFVLACGIEPGPSAGKVQSPNHWTAKEFPKQGGWTQSKEGKSGSSIIFLILALHSYKQPCQRCFLALFLCRL